MEQQISLNIKLSAFQRDLITKILYNAYLKNVSYQEDALHNQDVKKYCHYTLLEKEYKACMNKFRLPDSDSVEPVLK